MLLDPIPDELDEEDVAAIEESEAPIERGEDLDWAQVSAALREKYLGKQGLCLTSTASGSRRVRWHGIYF